MASIEEQIRNQVANIEATTGRSMADWIGSSARRRHREARGAVAMLKADHGLGHGNANLIVIKAREADAGGAQGEEA